MTHRLILTLLTAIALQQSAATVVTAQNSTAAPLSSKKEDVQGDPSGAIRALENASEGKKSKPVTIPKMGGEGASRTGGASAGTEPPAH